MSGGFIGLLAILVSFCGVLAGTLAAPTTALAYFVEQGEGIAAEIESPENGPVSGLGVIRGWVFTSQPGESFGAVELFIDGQSIGQAACCSERADVQAAFSEFPTENTLNSGWSLTFNWGVLNAGAHTLQLFIRGRAGQLSLTDTHTVTVVKPGDFEYIDRFDFVQATASIQDNELILNDVIVRDKASQQQKQINTRFRWFESSQNFAMVGTETVAQVSLLRSGLSSLFASLAGPFFSGFTTVASAQTSPWFLLPQALFEEPQSGQEVSGIGVIRGWAFYQEGERRVEKVWLSIDDQPAGTISCCSDRADVAAAFPESPNALHSGWGEVFNYGLLSPGPHTLKVEPVQLFGYDSSLSQSVWVIRLGGFEFLDQFDLSAATVQIVKMHPWGLAESAEIRLEGVKIRDKASQEEKVITVYLRWFVNSQTLGFSRPTA